MLIEMINVDVPAWCFVVVVQSHEPTVSARRFPIRGKDQIPSGSGVSRFIETWVVLEMVQEEFTAVAHPSSTFPPTWPLDEVPPPPHPLDGTASCPTSHNGAQGSPAEVA